MIVERQLKIIWLLVRLLVEGCVVITRAVDELLSLSRTYKAIDSILAVGHHMW